MVWIKTKKKWEEKARKSNCTKTLNRPIFVNNMLLIFPIPKTSVKFILNSCPLSFKSTIKVSRKKKSLIYELCRRDLKKKKILILSCLFILQVWGATKAEQLFKQGLSYFTKIKRLPLLKAELGFQQHTPETSNT